MTDKTFEFEPRFALVMANLKTAREVNQVVKDEGEVNIKNFLKYIHNILYNRLPIIQEWKYKFNYGKGYISIDYYLDDNWKIFKDDYICIYITMYYGIDILSCVPEVGLYAPTNWKNIKKFTEKLNDNLTKSFKNQWEEPEDGYPIWQYVKIENYAKGDSFDTNGFVNEIEESVRKLVDKKDIIDSTIKQVER